MLSPKFLNAYIIEKLIHLSYRKKIFRAFLKIDNIKHLIELYRAIRNYFIVVFSYS